MTSNRVPNQHGTLKRNKCTLSSEDLKRNSRNITVEQYFVHKPPLPLDLWPNNYYLLRLSTVPLILFSWVCLRLWNGPSATRAGASLSISWRPNSSENISWLSTYAWFMVGQHHQDSDMQLYSWRGLLNLSQFSNVHQQTPTDTGWSGTRLPIYGYYNWIFFC